MVPHWEENDEIELLKAQTFEDLAAIAMRVLKRMPKPIMQICGPITTGGKGSLTKNLDALEEAIEQQTKSGHHVFNQLPFQGAMFRILKTPYYKGHEDHLLTTFYRSIFGSGLIDTLCFLPGWESSYGASWEHQEAQRLGIKIVNL